MGKFVEKRKKKKGRPSLLDLQKRALKEQQQNKRRSRKIPNSNKPPNSTRIYNSSTPSPLRRSGRRRDTSPSAGDGEDAELNGTRRREKKLKLVLQKSDPNLTPSNSNCSGENDDNALVNRKKRRIDAIGDGSAGADSEKGEKLVSESNQATNVQQDLGPSTRLPDKMLLFFILDRLEKKDTHGVFSEPVDPEELPDYHEVIEHPMDFGTVRKKLSDGKYADLEQFEKDVFLICTNAMQYNAPDTIYFRQARSIQELAQKNFENLRQDSDDNEPEPKVVRRGRPPMKSFKRLQGRHSLDYAASEFSSDATPATGGESTTQSNNDLRKGSYLSHKSSIGDSSGRFHGVLNSAYCSTDNSFDRNEENTGSIRYGKKQFTSEGNRRNTYKQFNQFMDREPSVLATFDSERKQLIAVGLFSEYGYARSLARFAANIGPVAWAVASKKIERSLPQGIKFGPGWVGENDIPPQKPAFLPSFPVDQPPSSWLLPHPVNSSANVSSCSAEVEGKIPEKPQDELSDRRVCMRNLALDGGLNHPLPPSASTVPSHFGASKSDCHPGIDAVEGIFRPAFDTSSSAGAIRPSSFQFHQHAKVQPGMNGLSTHSEQTGISETPFKLQPFQMAHTVNGLNPNLVRQWNAHHRHSERLNNTNESGTINSEFPVPGRNAINSQEFGLRPQPPMEELTEPQSGSGLLWKKFSATEPPDLNEEIQSGSPASSTHLSTLQPDLGLQF